MEVLVGITVLAMAIVAAGNMLNSMVRSNHNNLRSMQAYYLAQEGIEAVRNIRDTNWLHNSYWLGEDDGQPWGVGFSPDNSYDVKLSSAGWQNVPGEVIEAENLSDLSAFAPWSVEILGGDESAEIYLHDGFLSSSTVYSGEAEETGFTRRITIKEYSEEGTGCMNGDEKTVCVLVESTVGWRVGGREADLTVFAVLSDWKADIL